MSCVQHGIMRDRLCIQFLVRREDCCSINCTVTRNITEVLSASGKYALIVIEVSVIKVAIYGQVRQEVVLKKPTKLCPVPRFH